MKTSFSKIVLCALALLLADGRAGELRERFEKNFPLERGGSFTLDNTNGAVHIVAWDRNEVKIEAEKVAQARREEEAQKLLEATEIVVRQGSNSVEVKTRTPRSKDYGDSFWSWVFGAGNGGVAVTYWISIPKGVDVKIETVNGQINVRELSGRIELETTNGGIEVDEAEGSVSASTTNGKIRVALAKVTPSETMNFETTNGGITAEFPSDFSANISARTTNGKVNCEFPLVMQGRFGRNELEGKIGSDGGQVYLRTTNGSISILKRS